MRRLAQIVVSFALLAVPALAAEEGGHGHIMLFRVVNFLILAGVLGFLIRKNAGPFFTARGEAIRNGIAEAQRQLEDSQKRAAAIEERLSRLGQEIAELRAGAKAEMAAEHARIGRQTEHAVKKVFAQAEQEMAAAVRAARLELKAYAAALAVGLAEKKIAGRITPQAHNALVSAFVRDLGRPPA